MRDSIAGAWLYGIVIVFMAFFIAFIAITVNYSKAYRLNVELIRIVEEYNGLTDRALQKMDAKIRDYGYLVTGTCGPRTGQSVVEDERWVGVTNGTASRKAGLYQYCVTRTEKSEGGRNVTSYYYYNVTVFFGFDLPFFGEIFTFRVQGSTAGIPASIKLTGDAANDKFEDSIYERLPN